MRVLKCLTLFSFLLLASCLSEKKAERIKADAIEQHKREHPCVFIPEKPVFIKGGVDSIPYAVPVEDTAKTRAAIDSVKNSFHTNCGKEIEAAYKKGFKDASSQFANQKLAVPRPDTVKIEYGNKTDVDFWRNQSDFHKQQSLEKDIVIAEEKTKRVEAESKARTRLWILIAIAALIIGFTGFRLWMKIKSGGIKGLSI